MVWWCWGVELPPDRSGRTNGELDITTADGVLDFELRKPGIESKLLNNTSVLARRQPRVFSDFAPVGRLPGKDGSLSFRRETHKFAHQNWDGGHVTTDLSP